MLLDGAQEQPSQAGPVQGVLAKIIRDPRVDDFAQNPGITRAGEDDHRYFGVSTPESPYQFETARTAQEVVHHNDVESAGCKRGRSLLETGGVNRFELKRPFRFAEEPFDCEKIQIVVVDNENSNYGVWRT